MTVFGYTWSQIQDMQQQRHKAPSVPWDKMKTIGQIVRDIERFKIPVSEVVVNAYQLTLPDGYLREGDTFTYHPPVE